jgi:hypothetical protein
MSEVRLHRVRRGYSHEAQVAHALHRCDPRKWTHLLQPDGTFDTTKMQPDDDLLTFPIGRYGDGMPLGIPFQAVAICPACDADVWAWFAWS